MYAKYKKAIPNFKGWRLKKLICVLLCHDSDEVFTLEVVSMLHAEAGIDRLLRENLDGEEFVAAFQAAPEGQVHGFRVVVAEDDVLGLDAFDVLLLLLTLLDIAVKFAVLCNRMAPEFATATGFLANFELDTLFLFVFGKLHKYSVMMTKSSIKRKISKKWGRKGSKWTENPSIGYGKLEKNREKGGPRAFDCLYDDRIGGLSRLYL